MAKVEECTGWPPGMLQDDSRELSQWLATRLDARRHVREAALEIMRPKARNMKHQVSELSGALLDAAVAMAEGLSFKIDRHAIMDPDPIRNMLCGLWSAEGAFLRPYQPTSDCSVSTPIIERELICSWALRPGEWRAKHPNCDDGGYYRDGRLDVTCDDGQLGRTQLEACMRAYVASRFGEYVELLG